MDVKYVNPFVDAAKNVFQTMLGLDVEFNAGGLKVNKDGEASHYVSGIIGLSGDVVGVVVLSFSRITACRIVTKFTGTEIGEEHEDFADGIGELTNMIAGNAKKDLDGLNIQISLPSVIIGRSHVVKSRKFMPRLVIPCTTEIGSFVIEVGMEKIDKTKPETLRANAR